VSLASQISFIAECNAELPDNNNEGLFYDSYSLKENN
jgi:hypothetical protein